MPDTSSHRQRRRLRLKISVHEDEKLTAEKAAELEGVSLSRWARARLFGTESGVSSLIGGLTEGQERSQVVVLLAVIATRLDVLCEEATPDSLARVAGLLRAHRDHIVHALNHLFTDGGGEPLDDRGLQPIGDLEPVS